MNPPLSFLKRFSIYFTMKMNKSMYRSQITACFYPNDLSFDLVYIYSFLFIHYIIHEREKGLVSYGSESARVCHHWNLATSKPATQFMEIANVKIPRRISFAAC
ncbi:hypothetical protein AAHE18_11G235600 [Arachis hypogaea]